jgi:hypothetical protein
MRRAWLIALTGLLLAVLFGIYVFKASPGKGALKEMNQAALAGVQADFNRDATKVRVILLLSPT